MSSRRKAKVAKKEAASTPKTTPSWRREPEFKIERASEIDPEETGELIAQFINKSHENYVCPKCEGQEHKVDIDEFKATVFTCSSCGEKINIVSPMFFGKGHDRIMGYAIMEITGNPDNPFQPHYIGYAPGM